jgi:hypothetical protein
MWLRGLCRYLPSLLFAACFTRHCAASCLVFLCFVVMSPFVVSVRGLLRGGGLVLASSCERRWAVLVLSAAAAWARQVIQYFREFGEIAECSVVRDRATNTSKGWC